MRKQPVNDEKRRREHSAQVVAQHRCRRFKLGEPGQLAGHVLIRLTRPSLIGHHVVGYLGFCLEPHVDFNLQ